MDDPAKISHPLCMRSQNEKERISVPENKKLLLLGTVLWGLLRHVLSMIGMQCLAMISRIVKNHSILRR